MIIKELNRVESESAMKEWIAKYPELPNIDNYYMKIRKEIQYLYKKVKDDLPSDCNKINYFIDIHFGILLYEYFWKQKGFSLRTATNDGLWRYISLKVVPDIVADRWGKESDSHYWSKTIRIYLKSIWWYIHLSWQGNSADTLHILEKPCFSTDSILNLQERTGRKGTFITVYRYIMYYYSKVPKIELDKFNNRKNSQDDLFRIIMKLNTARVMVIDPGLYLGGEKEYVRSLFKELGVSV